MTDREIDSVLQLASVPPVPPGAMARLMAVVEATPQEPVVFAFAPRRRRFWPYAAAVPLAASLALGIWLGANGRMDFVMPAALVAGDDGAVDDLGGMGDAFAEEDTI